LSNGKNETVFSGVLCTTEDKSMKLNVESISVDENGLVSIGDESLLDAIRGGAHATPMSTNYSNCVNGGDCSGSANYDGCTGNGTNANNCHTTGPGV
jgi:hypothetical protein